MKTKKSDRRKTNHKKKIRSRKKEEKQSNKLLIIFDVDDTLIKSIFSNYITSYKNTEYRIVKNKGKNLIFLVRKYVHFLLEYCFHYCEVGFWSNGEKGYIKSILKNILNKEQYKKTKFIISRDKINETSTEYIDLISKRKLTIQNINNTLIKPLDILFSHRYFKKICNEKKTVLIDDNLSNIAVNPLNSLLVPKYTYHIDDIYLFEIFMWLQKNKDSKNIQKVSMNLFDYSKNIANEIVIDKYFEYKKDIKIGDFIKVKNDPNIFGYIIKKNKNNVEIIVYDDEPYQDISNKFSIQKINIKNLINYSL